jgi:hypothetical protein
MNTPTIHDKHEAECLKLISIGRKLIQLCNIDSPNFTDIARRVLKPHVIDKTTKQERRRRGSRFSMQDLNIALYNNQCRHLNRKYRNYIYEGPEPDSDHSRATGLATFRFIHMANWMMKSFSPLSADTFCPNLPEAYRDLNDISTCLMSLHRMQIRADQTIPASQEQGSKAA